MADTVGKQRVRSESNTDVVIRLVDSAGTNLAAVDASGNVATNIAAQTLAGIKTSRDGAAPTAANGNFAEITTGNAVLAVGNPAPVRLGNGTAFNSATVPVFSQLTNGTTVNAVTAPAFFQLSDGTAAFGTTSNPLQVSLSQAGPSGATTVRQFNNATVASGGTTNVDYTVTAGKTLTLESIVVSGPAAGNYLLTVNGVDVLKLYTTPGMTTASYTFERPLTAAATQVVRVAKNNDDNQTAEMGFTWEGYEV